MEQLDLDEIMRKNPHLDWEAFEGLQKSLKEFASDVKAHYRLAPTGTHRATIGEHNDVQYKETVRTKSRPGF